MFAEVIRVHGAQRLNSADDKKRSFLTVRWNELLAISAPCPMQARHSRLEEHQPSWLFRE